MTKILYPYQKTFLEDIRIKLFKSKRIIACCATGGGKTVVFVAIAHMANSKGKTILILTEADKIFKQINEEFTNATEISSKVKTLEVIKGNIYTGMAQTMAKRPNIITQFQALGDNLLIIADEAHIGTATALLLQFPNAFLIGFTATPIFQWAKHLPLLYRDIAAGAQPNQLVDEGFLAPYRHFERRVANLGNLKKGSNGEFTEASQEYVFEKKEVFDCLLEDLKKFTYKKAMIFCASIKNCEDVAHKLRALDYKVCVVHSKNDESSFELFQFMDISSGVDICVSVASLTKGFNYKPIDLIVLNRASTSTPLVLQMIGRGSRTSPFTGKTHFNVLDFGGNGTRHLPWNYERDYENLWKGSPKKKTDGVPPVKICPICEAMVHVSATKCDACGHIFVKPPPTAKETELVEINTAYNALRGRNISTLTPLELRDYVKSTNKKSFGIRIAKAKGFDFLCKYSKAMGYKAGFAFSNRTHEVIEFADIIIR